ncbi:DUF4198 domain-containing protein [Lautropia mirabilis]|jgi:hypothetical protein|uniref:DUF4198 domain-containing protein n=1 Tax=Lautropia mirabilis TaxID=47671 RepID=UPI001CAF3B8F|nr:DUF4198 domain-containing protein [Lautropia mirabilis]MBF1248728.1 DUF4198 domain-containing protein [Lautropia mirabilis]
MKKLLVASLLCTASLAQAHDLWVTAPATLSPSETLKADLSYSHDFPYPDEIPADRLHIFEPLHITSPDGTKKDLVQQGKNYQYVSESQLAKGSYVITANYRPTFWSEFADDTWAQGDLTKNPTAVACQQAQMFGKSIVVVDGGENLEAIRRPIGQELEIVPLANPNSAKMGKLFPVRVLFQGKPLADEIVTATADTIALMDEEATHDHREPQIFSGKTDKEGKVNIIPLVEGFWKVKVKHKTPFANQKQCHENSLSATLAMQIGTKRVDIGKPHTHD